MDLQFQMQLRQSQKLVMTPALRQAIEILQYNALELKTYIDSQMLENPILEYDEEAASSQHDEVVKDQMLDDVAFDKMMWLSDNRRNYHTYQTNYYDPEKNYNYEQIVAATETLHDHLYSQLRFLALTKDEYQLAKFLIQYVDTNGYLFIDYEALNKQFDVTENQLENVVKILQTLEPYGVAARNLAESLMIQLKMKQLDDVVCLKIAEFHLDDLANNRIKQIAKALEQSYERVQSACDVIKSLNPRPGAAFGKGANVKYLEPDIFLKKIDDGYVIFMNDSVFPRLRLNHYYQQILKARQLDPVTANYINKKINGALHVIKSIEQRSATIRKVVEVIVANQYDFFEKGHLYLKALNLRDVATTVGVHESTVSRAISGKYLQCQRGIFELKFFFPSGVAHAYGTKVSAESIKSVIRDIIAHEDARKPVSDQKIANQLAAIGVKISRRTIAKYRESLGILASSKRRRY